MPTRRELLRLAGAAGLSFGAASVLAACDTGNGTTGTGTDPGGDVPGPLDLPSDDLTVTGDIAFQGYGDAFWKEVAARMEEEYPNVTVDLNFAPNVWESLQPKFATGGVPDIAYPGFQANIQQLALEGALLPLDTLAESPAFGMEDSTFRDLWYPRAIEYGTWDGTWYALPLAEISWLLWYDQTLFEEQGWQVPTHWDEFVQLCEEMNSSGIQAIGNPGAAPAYWNECIHHGLLWKLGGEEFALAVDNLEPGAWERPEVREALEMERDLFDRGFVRPASRGLSNIDNQLNWLRGESGIIPSGTWLENEMRNEIPDGFVFGAMPVPGVEGSGGGHASDIRTWFSELQIIPRQAENLAAAQEYYRIFFSQEMAQTFADVAKGAMPIEGRYEGVELTPAMESVQQLQDNAEQSFDFLHSLWYSRLRAEQPEPLAAFLYGGSSAEDYMQAMEDLNASVREDDSIVKHTRS